MGAIDIQTEVVIARPRAEVAAFMFDPGNDAAWTKAVIAVRPLTPGRLRPGSKVERTVRFLGREFAYLYEVDDADETGFVALRVEKPFPMQVRYELEDAGEGATRARIRARGDSSGFFRVAAPLMSRMVRRNITKDLEALRACLEG